MKCPECGGYGKVGEYNYYGTCPQCGGSGEVEQTNEEWLRTATTEELAEFICGIQTDGALQVDCMTYKERLVWLKQPHKPIS